MTREGGSGTEKLSLHFPVSCSVINDRSDIINNCGD